MKLPDVREHYCHKKDKDTIEKKIWKRVHELISEIAKMGDPPEFVRGLKIGIYFIVSKVHFCNFWTSGNGSVFAEETRKRLGLNQHQYNICCEAIINHKYNDEYRDLHLQKKTRDEIINDLTKLHFLRDTEIKRLLDYYDKYR